MAYLGENDRKFQATALFVLNRAEPHQKPYSCQCVRTNSRCCCGGKATGGKLCFLVASIPTFAEWRLAGSICETSAGAWDGSSWSACILSITKRSLPGWLRQAKAQATWFKSRMSMSSSTTTLYFPKYGWQAQEARMASRG